MLCAYSAIDRALGGGAFMGSVVELVTLAAAISAFDMRFKRKARETALRTDSE